MSTAQPKPVSALRALLDRLIDYAGLFPPAALDMPSAVTNYARYRAGEYRWALGRFILPVSRLAEFRAAHAQFATRGDAWRLSALVTEADAATVGEFNFSYGKFAIVDTIEAKAATLDEIDRILNVVPSPLLCYFEVPLDASKELLSGIAEAGARAKIRTGGVTPQAFPASAAIARFLFTCAEARCSFKATAGLHHPLRCVRPLTYELDAQTGTMHGFLNLLLCAAAVHASNGAELSGLHEAQLADLLDAMDAVVEFDGDRAELRVAEGNVAISVDTAAIQAARSHFANSFGSCSFEEPIADLRDLGLL